MRLTRLSAAAVACYALLAMLAGTFAHAQPVSVTLRHGDGNTWQLIRDDKPYFVQGAGGQSQLKLLVECSGNSIRTWGVDHLDKTLDEAQQLGLTVTAGIWLGHERHGFSYHDAKKVDEQL